MPRFRAVLALNESTCWPMADTGLQEYTPESKRAGRGATAKREKPHGQTTRQPNKHSQLQVFRANKPEEIECVRDIVHEYHAESRYAHIPFSEDKFKSFFVRTISHPENSIALYVRHGDKTVGLLSAAVGDYYLGADARIATIYVLYVSAQIRGTLLGGKVGLKLIRMVSEWAQSQHATELNIHATSGIDPQRTDKLLTRMGFVTYGGNYAARLG